MTKARDLANFVSTGNPLADGILAVADISDLTASAAELNILDGVTASTAELNTLDGITASTAELNILDGVTASAAELNYNDITTLGTSQASKVVTADANGDVKFANAIVETVYSLSGTTPALNPNNGTIQTCALSGNSTFTDSLSSGQSIVLMLTNGASYTVTFPTITWVTSGGNTAPTLTAADTLVFWKISTTLYGAYAGSFE